MVDEPLKVCQRSARRSLYDWLDPRRTAVGSADQQGEIQMKKRSMARALAAMLMVGGLLTAGLATGGTAGAADPTYRYDWNTRCASSVYTISFGLLGGIGNQGGGGGGGGELSLPYRLPCNGAATPQELAILTADITWNEGRIVTAFGGTDAAQISPTGSRRCSPARAGRRRSVSRSPRAFRSDFRATTSTTAGGPGGPASLASGASQPFAVAPASRSTPPGWVSTEPSTRTRGPSGSGVATVKVPGRSPTPWTPSARPGADTGSSRASTVVPAPRRSTPDG